MTEPTREQRAIRVLRHSHTLADQHEATGDHAQAYETLRAGVAAAIRHLDPASTPRPNQSTGSHQ